MKAIDHVISRHHFGIVNSSIYMGDQAHFSAQARKIKKIKNKRIYSGKVSYIFPRKFFLIFREMELSSPKIKNFLIFFPKEFFLYFKRELAKPEKQKFLIFWGIELYSPKIKRVAIFF